MIGIKCDGCNKMHATDLLTMRYADSLPDDWLSLYRGKSDVVEKVSHFCSLKCLNNWLAPQLTAPDPNTLYPDMLLSGPFPEQKEETNAK